MLSRMTNIKPKHDHGFTLIEALVALVVLSFGLLGVAGMQLKALQSAHSGYQRSIASLAAQDAQERAWAALAGTFPACPSGGDVDTGDWQTNWSTVLPGLQAITPLSDDGSCSFTVEVEWDEGRFGGSTETFTYTFRLPGAS